jgi:chorismate mutase/prephenate dehydratase
MPLHFMLIAHPGNSIITEKMARKVITRLRKRIDSVDRRITRLLLKRVRFVKEIGALKKKQNLPLVDRDREGRIEKRIEAVRADAITKEAVKRVYRAIFKGSYVIEKGGRTDDGQGN